MIYLPLEVWMHIARHLENDNSTLTNCARVCRHWQPVFEKLIYRTLKATSKGFKSLPHFQDLVLGTNQYRRSFVQHLEYTVIIPYDLPDYRTVKLDGYREQNPVRKANDLAFWAGMKSLFEFLSSWEKDCKFMLTVTAQGRDEALEPETEAKEDVHAWHGELDGEFVVGPYRARFPASSVLPRTTCVDNLSFPWMYDSIWAGTAMQIAESCVALQRLFLNMQDSSRPDHIWYLRDRRQAVASGLATLPLTLRVLELEGGVEEPWSNTLPALDLRPVNSNIDELSSSLRLRSCNLRELNLINISVDMDFLYPLDTDTPILGEWLFDYELSTEDEYDFPDPATGDEIFESSWLNGNYQIVRHVMNAEHFHRLFISLGYAARRMPRLKTISFDFGDVPVTKFTFDNSSGRPSLEIQSESGYRPDQRVADVWGFSIQQLVVEKHGWMRFPDSLSCSVILDR
ncbi:hypothetical protein BJY04DRAFT_211897 [Aspergillus karnatakaensis]|uniref:F-box protein n=1 Tax=Aspergillus karnatakaensis TaxID=1810916 RepID=UPI003CCCEB2E